MTNINMILFLWFVFLYLYNFYMLRVKNDNMCRVQLKDIKRVMDLMLMLSWNEAMDRLMMANSVCWYGHVFRMEDGIALRKTLDLEVEGQRKRLSKKA